MAETEPVRCPNPKCQAIGTWKKLAGKNYYKCETCGTRVTLP